MAGAGPAMTADSPRPGTAINSQSACWNTQDGMGNMDFQSDAAQPQLKVPFDVDLEEAWQ
jgi:hypothetical protein